MLESEIIYERIEELEEFIERFPESGLREAAQNEIAFLKERLTRIL